MAKRLNKSQLLRTSTTSASGQLVLEEREKKTALNLQMTEYYCALMAKTLKQKELTDLKKIHEDEVIAKEIYLERARLKKTQLQSEIKQLKLQTQLNTQMKVLHENTAELYRIITHTEVERKVDILKHFLEILSNTLFMENLNGFESKEMFTQFLSSFSEYLYEVENTGLTTANVSSLNSLLSNISQIKLLQDESRNNSYTYNEKVNKIFSLFLSAACNVLENGFVNS